MKNNIMYYYNLPIENLYQSNDYYYFDEIHYELVGQDSGVKYKLGERVLVQVKRVDIASKTIDFRLIDREDIDDGESDQGECEVNCQ